MISPDEYPNNTNVLKEGCKRRKIIISTSVSSGSCMVHAYFKEIMKFVCSTIERIWVGCEISSLFEDFEMVDEKCFQFRVRVVTQGSGNSCCFRSCFGKTKDDYYLCLLVFHSVKEHRIMYECAKCNSLYDIVDQEIPET